MASGKVRALASTAAERMKALPNIPSAREAGITNSDLTAWWSVHTPAKTDKAILAKLETWFNAVARDEEVSKYLANLGVDPFPGDSAKLKALLTSDMEAWARYVDLAKIEKL
jgi:tripartite-type tricarboxylate transporter receptor subunit TctC